VDDPYLGFMQKYAMTTVLIDLFDREV